MAKKISIQITGGTKEDTTLLPESFFGLPWNDALIAQYVRVYLTNQKRNTASTMTRGEVHGTTKKMYKQKGTGRARHGSKKAPIFVGGGLAHGPQGESGKAVMPKKMRRKALGVALSDKFKHKLLFVLKDTSVSKFEKTIQAQKALADWHIDIKKSVVVLPHGASSKRAFLNLPELTATEPAGLNAYRVLSSKRVVMTEKSLSEFIVLMKIGEKKA